VSFEITVAGADGSVWLRMTGPDGTRAVLQAELELRSSCNCDPGAERSRQLAKWTTAGGLLAALGVCSACCLLPFALVTVGVATAWAGALEALAAYKWPLVSVTATLLAYGFRVAYRKPRATCAAGTACQARAANRSLKIGLWVVTALAIAGLLFEQLEPHLK
jgi:mercuric ion transport protein